jgi:hypothetical protein
MVAPLSPAGEFGFPVVDVPAQRQTERQQWGAEQALGDQ